MTSEAVGRSSHLPPPISLSLSVQIIAVFANRKITASVSERKLRLFIGGVNSVELHTPKLRLFASKFP